MRLISLAIVAFLLVPRAAAQSTTFTYQGLLTDAGTPANGNFDLQFGLFDALTAGTQIGFTLARPNVTVTGGVFTVSLDFGAGGFPGADRHLEISVRPAGGSTFTTLAPRQPILSTPYAIRTLSAATADDATRLGGQLASAYAKTGDPVAANTLVGLVSTTNLPVGSTSNTVAAGDHTHTDFIQNTALPQTAAFNITGDGTIGGFLTARIVNGSAPPASPGAGRLYFDTVLKSLMVYDGTAWRAYVPFSISGDLQVRSSTNSCDADRAGSLRWVSSANQLEVCNGSAWKALAVVP